MRTTVQILWEKKHITGSIELRNQGILMQEPDFSVEDGRLCVCVEDALLDPGAFATVVTIRTEQPFSFFLRDIRADMPVYIPQYAVIVTTQDDTRSYQQIVGDITSGGRQTKLEQYRQQPEETFESAAAHNRNMPCLTWLGLSRDIHMFEVGFHTLHDPSKVWDTIRPNYHFQPVYIPEVENEPLCYHYFAGRGIGCRQDMHRWLEKGYLPILNAESIDDGVAYLQKHCVAFERSLLTEENVKGTHYLISDRYSCVPTKPTPEQELAADAMLDEQLNRDEEVVLYLQIRAENRTAAPKYAHVRIPQPNVDNHIPDMTRTKTYTRDGLCGFASSARIFAVGKLNGKPIQDVEYSILLAPGEALEFVFAIPHRPVSAERANLLLNVDYTEKLNQCISFWDAKLARTADVHLPEKRIEEMMKAGFLHLDLIAFGNNPDGAVAPCVGVYTPIGTESTPIIHYLASMGDLTLATRSVMYFLERQRPDGFMQNFSDYMSETGLGIRNAAELYKFTRDKTWLREHAGNLVSACNYLKKWADQSKNESLRGKGYGMLAGKVADPERPFFSFMLNATSYAAAKSCAEVLSEIGDENSSWIQAFADELKQNISESMRETFAISPVIPISDGSWVPACAQWPDMAGTKCLFADGGKAFTHGSMIEILDNGSYDIMYGTVEPDSVFADFIIKTVTEFGALENTSFSQPYYSVHPYAHLLRGEISAFLKEFYNNVSAMADRETYTFWEHYYQVSPHKTHEEAWFLMRCRWMLYMDSYKDTLALLPGIPRKWLEDGKEVSYQNMCSRYGRLSLLMRSNVSARVIHVEAQIQPFDGVSPREITIRVPHPDRCRPVSVSSGVFDPETETLHFDGSCEHIDVTLQY